jgi:hypothetical protein
VRYLKFCVLNNCSRAKEEEQKLSEEQGCLRLIDQMNRLIHQREQRFKASLFSAIAFPTTSTLKGRVSPEPPGTKALQKSIMRKNVKKKLWKNQKKAEIAYRLRFLK